MKRLMILLLLWAGSAHAASYKRIVTVGGSITEIVYQLDEIKKVVGTDTSSIYPTSAKKLPKVGYWMRLSAEGILSLKPDLVLASSQSKQPNIYEQLADAGVKEIKIDDNPSVKGAYQKISQIAKVLGKEKKGRALIAGIKKKLAKNQRKLAKLKKKPRVLFIYARGNKTLMVSGRATAAHEMIKLAGGQNAAASFTGFKPMQPEAVIKAAPDTVLMLDRGVQSLGGPKGVWQLPGLSLTPAGKNKNIITMDDLLLLGFGGRLGEATTELSNKLTDK